MLRIRFGPWRVRTPLTNIVSTTRTGPFSLVKTMGSARLSFIDRGLTCATNSEAGLCIHFATPVRGLDPLGLLRRPAVTVTVADCESLAKALGPARAVAFSRLSGVRNGSIAPLSLLNTIAARRRSGRPRGRLR